MLSSTEAYSVMCLCSGAQSVQLHQGSGGLRLTRAREALLQADTGVPASFHNTH